MEFQKQFDKYFAANEVSKGGSFFICNPKFIEPRNYLQNFKRKNEGRKCNRSNKRISSLFWETVCSYILLLVVKPIQKLRGRIGLGILAVRSTETTLEVSCSLFGQSTSSTQHSSLK